MGPRNRPNGRRCSNRWRVASSELTAYSSGKEPTVLQDSPSPTASARIASRWWWTTKMLRTCGSWMSPAKSFTLFLPKHRSDMRSPIWVAWPSIFSLPASRSVQHLTGLGSGMLALVDHHLPIHYYIVNALGRKSWLLVRGAILNSGQVEDRHIGPHSLFDRSAIRQAHAGCGP